MRVRFHRAAPCADGAEPHTAEIGVRKLQPIIFRAPEQQTRCAFRQPRRFLLVHILISNAYVLVLQLLRVPGSLLAISPDIVQNFEILLLTFFVLCAIM